VCLPLAEVNASARLLRLGVDACVCACIQHGAACRLAQQACCCMCSRSSHSQRQLLLQSAKARVAPLAALQLQARAWPGLWELRLCQAASQRWLSRWVGQRCSG
jgi:hypothetical protein